MKEEIQLSDHFGYGRLLKFVMPSVVMMIFTSIYGVVDGVFVSNFVGKTPFAAINIIFPLVMILGGFGFMLGVGGTAIVAKTLGLGDKERANEYFTFIIIATAGGGLESFLHRRSPVFSVQRARCWITRCSTSA